GPEGRIGVHSFARRRARQELKEYLQVVERRYELLDSEDRYERLWECRAEPAVPFGFDHAHRACFGNSEVRAADPDRNRQEPRAQIRPRRTSKLGRLVR